VPGRVEVLGDHGLRVAVRLVVDALPLLVLDDLLLLGEDRLGDGVDEEADLVGSAQIIFSSASFGTVCR
jgi:hypothetical protein